MYLLDLTTVLWYNPAKEFGTKRLVLQAPVIKIGVAAIGWGLLFG